MAAGLLVAVVGGDPSRGDGSGGRDVLIQSVPEVRCDEERAGAGGAGTDLNVEAVTEAWGRAEGSGPGLLKMREALGPVDVGVETAVGDSWDHYVEQGNHQVQGAAAAGATFGEGPVGVRLGKLAGPPEREDTEVAEDLPLPLRLVLRHPCHSAVASAADAVVSAVERLWSAAEEG